MRKIKVVVLLVQQLQHGFTKNAKVSPNLTVAHIVLLYISYRLYSSPHRRQSEPSVLSMLGVAHIIFTGLNF